MRALAVLTLRDEGAFLLEWLAHHRAVGFTDFLVFSNDCSDGTDAMLDRLQQMGALTHVPNPGPYDRRGIQFTALKQAERLPCVQQADWILCLDIDEFVNIHVGDHSLGALLSALPEATAITLTWRLFGNAGVVGFQDRPVTEVFTRAAPEVLGWPWRAALFKTLYRNDGTYRKIGVHRPRSPDKARLPGARWFDSHGRPLGPDFLTDRIFSDFGRPNYGLAQLNHYALGSMESYILKSARGRVNHASDRMAMDYWVERNFSTDEDRSVLALQHRRADLQAGYLGDPTLAQLHARAVAWRHARFKALMLEDDYRALFGRLLMCPPSQPVPASEQPRLIAFAHEARRRALQSPPS